MLEGRLPLCSHLRVKNLQDLRFKRTPFAQHALLTPTLEGFQNGRHDTNSEIEGHSLIHLPNHFELSQHPVRKEIHPLRNPLVHGPWELTPTPTVCARTHHPLRTFSLPAPTQHHDEGHRDPACEVLLLKRFCPHVQEEESAKRVVLHTTRIAHHARTPKGMPNKQHVPWITLAQDSSQSCLGGVRTRWRSARGGLDGGHTGCNLRDALVKKRFPRIGLHVRDEVSRVSLLGVASRAILVFQCQYNGSSRRHFTTELGVHLHAAEQAVAKNNDWPSLSAVVGGTGKTRRVQLSRGVAQNRSQKEGVPLQSSKLVDHGTPEP
mmetsp:Transcript_14320/g.38989  ORF Transcript_14320/g.38989 Transcript_14320/m.38989 type:complete len:321 (+) Transcript_14320:150-1112(+)